MLGALSASASALTGDIPPGPPLGGLPSASTQAPEVAPPPLHAVVAAADRPRPDLTATREGGAESEFAYVTEGSTAAKASNLVSVSVSLQPHALQAPEPAPEKPQWTARAPALHLAQADNLLAFPVRMSPPPPSEPKYNKQRTEALYREAERRVHARQDQRRQEEQQLSFMPSFEAQRQFKPEKPVFDRLYTDASHRKDAHKEKVQRSEAMPRECTFAPEVSVCVCARARACVVVLRVRVKVTDCVFLRRLMGTLPPQQCKQICTI